MDNKEPDVSEEIDVSSFSFTPATKRIGWPAIMVKESGAYLNTLAHDMFRNKAPYVELHADPENQAIKVVSVSMSGPGRHKLFGKSGALIQAERALFSMGMKSGTYLFLNDDVFQHTDNIE